jgi:hypothetical protein
MPTRRDVIFSPHRQGWKTPFKVVIIVLIRFFGEGFAHVILLKCDGLLELQKERFKTAQQHFHCNRREDQTHQSLDGLHAALAE